MSESADLRFAPPQAQVADIASEQVVLAGRGMRLLAAIVDGLILAGAFSAALHIPLVLSMMDAGPEADPWAVNLPAAALGVVLFLLIQGGPLVIRGQTLGKMLFRLRIVRTDGARPEAWRLLGLRYGVGLLMGVTTAVAMIYSLIDSLLIFRESRKCLHDSIAGTQVIQL